MNPRPEAVADAAFAGIGVLGRPRPGPGEIRDGAPGQGGRGVGGGHRRGVRVLPAELVCGRGRVGRGRPARPAAGPARTPSGAQAHRPRCCPIFEGRCEAIRRCAPPIWWPGSRPASGCGCIPVRSSGPWPARNTPKVDAGATSDTGDGTELAEHYEALRRVALCEGAGRAGLGVALLASKGMAAWMRGWRACTPAARVSPPSPARIATRSGRVVGGHGVGLRGRDVDDRPTTPLRRSQPTICAETPTCMFARAPCAR